MIRRKSVIGYRQPAVLCQGGDLHRLCEAAHAREIDLDDVDLAAIHELEERGSGASPNPSRAARTRAMSVASS